MTEEHGAGYEDGDGDADVLLVPWCEGGEAEGLCEWECQSLSPGVFGEESPPIWSITKLMSKAIGV